ncbi:hypothetical protein LZF95_14885 [Algoriphagus sp. AGSA1]|uniref:hypothetical protein n=1 Tax=Algoriphagus sp. AGSA1 TaxID=2907213 RepID=UPI001F4881FC|nr:hypothetical protein [Algoriphagus sp. AGSA1]MCE7055965.1 hypothetical protein [Algoriphagus sp. AGSA1]
MFVRKPLLLLINLLIFHNALSQAGIDDLFQQLKKERFLPKQEEIATQIYDSLEHMLKKIPADEVLSLIEPTSSDHLRLTTFTPEETTQARAVSILVLTHKNYFKEVYFSEWTSPEGTAVYAEEYYPTMQWTGEDGLLKSKKLYERKEETAPGSDYTFHSYKGTKSDFYEIHKLPSKNNELYLLSGINPSDRMPALLSFFVVEIKDDELSLDYPAFEGISPLLQCTIYDRSSPDAYFKYFEYDREKQLVKLRNLKKEETVTVNKDVYRSSYKVLNHNKEVEITLKFADSGFYKVD